jgi:hypothetical protein
MLCVLCLCVKSLKFWQELGLETLKLFWLATVKNRWGCIGIKETPYRPSAYSSQHLQKVTFNYFKHFWLTEKLEKEMNKRNYRSNV